MKRKAQAQVKLENMAALMLMQEESAKDHRFLKSPDRTNAAGCRRSRLTRRYPKESRSCGASGRKNPRKTIEALNAQIEQMRLAAEVRTLPGDAAQITEFMSGRKSRRKP